MSHSNRTIWERSRVLSRAYWTQYQKLIGPIGEVVYEDVSQTDYSTQESDSGDSTVESEPGSEVESEPESEVETESEGDPDIAIDVNLELEEPEPELEEEVNREYLEFIKITRQHQEERDRLKQLVQKKRPDLNAEEYYMDISQVNTLIEDNLAEAPDKKNLNQLSSVEKREEKLIELYGGREVYERIRSMEMSIDEHFNRKLQELAPKYWPVMPLNPKPYLNPIKT